MEESNLLHDTLLRTLARMSYADTNTQCGEVETIQKIYQEVTGKEVSTADVRVASRADLYEREPFDRYLLRIQKDISLDDKMVIMSALAEVIRVDGNVSPGEIDFFNQVGQCLKLNPADLKELTAGAID